LTPDDVAIGRAGDAMDVLVEQMLRDRTLRECDVGPGAKKYRSHAQNLAGDAGDSRSGIVRVPNIKNAEARSICCTPEAPKNSGGIAVAPGHVRVAISIEMAFFMLLQWRWGS
jgi:hypothetical protein